jgi:elongation factor Ts
MAVDAAQVKALRERTGAGMMDCKKALVDAQGDLDLASELLRKAGQAKADKKASRIAAEGAVVIAGQGGSRALVEINSETDFVAKDENFRRRGAKHRAGPADFGRQGWREHRAAALRGRA